MEVTLSPEMERFVAERVQAGQYDSVSAMVENALAALREDDQLEDSEKLKAQIAVGMEQIKRGEAEPLDMGAVRAAVRQERI